MPKASSTAVKRPSSAVDHACSTPSCCQRHPRVAGCSSHAAPATPLATSSSAPPPFLKGVHLLISSPIAAYVSTWYVRAAVRNWLRFTLTTTHIVLHMDRARAANFSDATLDSEWRWLRDGGARERVLINDMRLNTYRRSGSLLVAHLQNVDHARRVLWAAPPTHVLFVAHNCFFFRVGIEAFVSSRGSTAAIRACPEVPIRPNKHHCTTQPWFAPLNAHRATGRRLLLEGQFYPLELVTEMTRQLQSRDAKGQPFGGSGAVGRGRASGGSGASGGDGGARDGGARDGGVASVAGAATAATAVGATGRGEERSNESGGAIGRTTLLAALLGAACTAEENLLPAMVLRAPRVLLADGPPTEAVAWLPRSLSNGSFIEGGTVRWLLGSVHTPQSLCHGAAHGAAHSASAGGCAVCPDPQIWPQTKFVVKRVADDVGDRSGVRRLIASLPGVGEPQKVDRAA